MEGLPSVASRRISGQFSNPTKQLGGIVLSNGRSNGPCSWARHSRRSAVQPRMSLSVTRPMRKREIFTVLRAGLASPIARYSLGARIAGQRATQNEQYKRSVRPRLRLRRLLRSMRRKRQFAACRASARNYGPRAADAPGCSAQATEAQSLKLRCLTHLAISRVSGSVADDAGDQSYFVVIAPTVA